MSLASRLAQLPIDPAKQYCTVGRLIAQLEPMTNVPVEEEEAYEASIRDYRAFLGALSTPSWGATTLARAVAQEGWTLDRRHVSDHRKGHGPEVCVRPTVGVIHSEGAE